MVVAIWQGESKPILNEYIESFVTEMKSLLETGIIVSGHHFEIRFGVVICDTPARALLKGIAFIRKFDYCYNHQLQSETICFSSH